MKNIFKYLALAGCMSFFFSCAGEGENEKVVDPYIEADPTTMSVDCAGIETVINIESNAAWTLSRTDEAGEVIDWVLFDRLYDDGTTEVAVKVLENSSLEGRTAIITFDADGAIAKLTITQAGNPDAEVYLLYGENGKAEGYMVLAREQYYYVNRMASVNLHVREICFTSPESLLKLLGFLRM